MWGQMWGPTQMGHMKNCGQMSFSNCGQMSVFKLRRKFRGQMSFSNCGENSFRRKILYVKSPSWGLLWAKVLLPKILLTEIPRTNLLQPRIQNLFQSPISARKKLTNMQHLLIGIWKLQTTKVEALEFPECSAVAIFLTWNKSAAKANITHSHSPHIFLGSLKGSRRSLLSYRIGCGSWFTNKSHLDNRCIGGLLLPYVKNVAAKLRCIGHTAQQTFIVFGSYAMKSFHFHYFSRDLIILCADFQST